MNKIDAVAEAAPSWQMTSHIFKRDGRRCQYCGTARARNYVMEHVIPWSMGGHTATYNLVVACQSCNNRKRDKVWLPININALFAENCEWGEQILELAADWPPLAVTLSGHDGWWLARTAQAQGLTVDQALSMAIVAFCQMHCMTIVDPPEGIDTEEAA